MLSSVLSYTYLVPEAFNGGPVKVHSADHVPIMLQQPADEPGVEWPMSCSQNGLWWDKYLWFLLKHRRAFVPHAQPTPTQGQTQNYWPSQIGVTAMTLYTGCTSPPDDVLCTEVHVIEEHHPFGVPHGTASRGAALR